MIDILAIVLNFIVLAGAVQEKFMYIYLEYFNLCYIFYVSNCFYAEKYCFQAGKYLN
jgi:hypothetical protein